MQAKIRLYLDQPMTKGQALALGEAQANYLFNVMRLGPADQLAVFNGRDGEWLAEVVEAGKRRGVLRALALRRPQAQAPDLWLLFAPIRKHRLDFLVEKAVEMGVGHLQPVQTRHTNAERLRADKMQAHMVEAAEQCEALWVPSQGELVPLDRLLAGWDPGRRIYWAAERGERSSALAGNVAGPAAILIGPEGGFSEDEKAMLGALPFVVPLGLGPRILRAETAAVAALALWQSALGDWR